MAMTCRNKEIQALLPAHLERSLDQESQAGVDRHVAVCEDCRTELALLRMMSEEPVPDPGAAFWAAMPGKIFRAMADREQQRTSLWASFRRMWHILPRWAFAGASLLLVAAVVMLLDRPGNLDSARNTPDENGSTYGTLLSAEPVDLAELTDIELDSVDVWATDELAQLRDVAIDIFRNSTEISVDDRLAELDPQELEQLSRMLDAREEG